MLRMFRNAFVIGVLAVASCAPKTAPVATAPPSATTPIPDAIRWVRESAEYQAAVIQVYRLATARMEQLAASRQPGTWAVILDADETIINNSTYQLERARQGLGYSGESWTAWVKRREATPLPGAASFLSRVRALGGKIAVVTNRLGSECDDTRAVFDAQKLVFDAMLCRPDGTPSDKNGRFEAVATGAPFGTAAAIDVLLYIGDNILDFPRMAQSVKSQGVTGFTDFGVRYFLLPNPMYGSWQ